MIGNMSFILIPGAFTDDVSPELALETIDSIEVLGVFRANNAVKAALVGRIR